MRLSYLLLLVSFSACGGGNDDGPHTPASFTCGAHTCDQADVCLSVTGGLDAGVTPDDAGPSGECVPRTPSCDSCDCIDEADTCGFPTEISCSRAADGHLDVICHGV